MVVTDLTGLEYATNLKTLAINNAPSDLSIVPSVISLTDLTLGSLTHTAIPNLNSLVGLENLAINMPISSDDFTKRNQLPELVYLSFTKNMKITSISLLAQLPKLEYLNIQNCGLSDFRVISQFPSLILLDASGQGTGRYDPIQPIFASSLIYDETSQSMFIPFSLMPNRLTNFDGYQPPFTTSILASNTILELNDVQVSSTDLVISDTGITVQNVTRDECNATTSFNYNARYNNVHGTYVKSSNFIQYFTSSGTYLQMFRVDHSISITTDPSISFPINTNLSEADFLLAVHASTNDESIITSDVLSKVDFTKVGDYTVTLNAKNNEGTQAKPVTIMVSIVASINPPIPENPITLDPVVPTPPITIPPFNPTTPSVSQNVGSSTPSNANTSTGVYTLDNHGFIPWFVLSILCVIVVLFILKHKPVKNCISKTPFSF